MIVYIIDKRAPRAPSPASLEGLIPHQDDFEQGWRRVVQALPGHEDAKVVTVGSEERIRDLMTRVQTIVQTHLTIWLLRILAHGRPGFIELGEGLQAANAHHFSHLANYMTPSGRGVEIHGCEIAASRQGMDLVQRIADAVRKPVIASPHWQGADNRFQFENRDVFRAEPHLHRRRER